MGVKFDLTPPSVAYAGLCSYPAPLMFSEKPRRMRFPIKGGQHQPPAVSPVRAGDCFVSVFWLRICNL